jgi:selenide,water dikinase
LRHIIDSLPLPESEHLLTGFGHSEDAAVFRLDDERAVVFTIDVITPIVDDPESYGAIAAANALSDVYAMGGRGLLALSFLGAPKGFSVEIAAAIAKGGAELAKAEGAPVAGGHSIETRDLMYGLAVVGLVDPEALFRNDGFAAGDDLVLTKPIGTGTLMTALKQRALDTRDVAEAIAGMRRTNRAAAEIAIDHGVVAATDITGFGLAGHAAEVASASNACCVIAQREIPEYPGARRTIGDGYVTRANRTNLDYVQSLGPLAGEPEPLLFDPQTSGGLLIAVARERCDSLLDALRAAGYDGAARIGHVTSGSGIRVV